MIKFFRKIRQKLLSENKFSQYLKYAIGEIALLVIGILIALSINNWNEKRKENQLWENYKDNLRVEIESNFSETIRLLDWHQQKHDYGELIVKTLAEDMIVGDQDTLFAAVELFGWLYSPPGYVQDVWGELYSTGNINLIKNDRLRSKLTVLYRKLNQYRINSEEMNSYILGYRRIVTRYVPATIRMDFVHYTDERIYRGGFKDYPDMEKLFSNLRKQEELQGYLADIMMTNTGLITTYLDQVLPLFEEILKELN